MKENLELLNFAYAFGEPSSCALFRAEYDDFVVEEELGFEPAGEGEHLFVHIKKRGENSAWVAEKLAGFFSVKVRDVGLCGMKDRHACTSQWFSVYLPGFKEHIDWPAFIEQASINVEILEYTFHSHKLRRGSHRRNHFTIRLREVEDIESLPVRLLSIGERGVPNYFGEQRFGREGNNLALAREWISGKQKIRSRDKRSIVMSAARSLLFNVCLSARVSCGTWSTTVDGDVLQEDMPTGSLWGRGLRKVLGDALSIEDRALIPFVSWCDHLEHVGLNQERRSFVLKPHAFAWEFEGTDLVLRFGLAPGQYATAVLRELCILNNLAERH